MLRWTAPVIAFIFACDASPHAGESQRAPSPALAPAPTLEDTDAPPSPLFHYEPAGRRDPFRSTSVDIDPPPITSSAQLWSLDQLRLSALIFSAGQPRALLVSPDGQGHIVRRATPVGRRSAFVHSIFDDRIVVREDGFDARGRRRRDEYTMTLQ